MLVLASAGVGVLVIRLRPTTPPTGGSAWLWALLRAVACGLPVGTLVLLASAHLCDGGDAHIIAMWHAVFVGTVAVFARRSWLTCAAMLGQTIIGLLAALILMGAVHSPWWTANPGAGEQFLAAMEGSARDRAPDSVVGEYNSSFVLHGVECARVLGIDASFTITTWLSGVYATRAVCVREVAGPPGRHVALEVTDIPAAE